MNIKKLQIFKTCTFLFLGLLSFISKAQYTPTNVAPYNSPSFLINNILLGSGVTATNIVYQGKPVQLGYFSGGMNGATTGGVNMGIDSGIVLSTGDIYDMAAPQSTNAATGTQTPNNFPSDADILQIIQTNNAGGSANDAAIIEFDFTPLGDTVKFDYMFGSEEYPEFVCSFNDGFGMFLSGPGITGPYTNNAENIALVPYTNPPVPVSIYNVNSSTGSCAWANNNDSLYVSNTGGSDFSLDGFTKVFTAQSPVQCGSTYHLKIAIADANDHTYDSGVFLKARSLVSNQVGFIPTSSSGIVGDSSLVEGCTAGALTFTRPGAITDTLEVYVTVNSATAPIPSPWGTAVEGQDFNSLPDTIVFLPGVAQVSIPVNAFQDGIAEGTEGIAISLQFQSGCGGLTQFTRYMYIINPLPVQAVVNNVSVCPGDSATIIATPLNGYPPFTYLWSTGDTTSSISILPTLDSVAVSVTIASTCTGTADVDSAMVYLIPFNPISINTSYPNSQTVENCGDTIFVEFELDFPSTIPLSLSVNIGPTFGAATNGVDYHTTANALFPSTINFNVGDSIVIVPLIITPDNIPEFNESVSIGINQISQCSGATPSLFISIVDFDSVTVFVTNPSPVCPGVLTDLFANAFGTNSSTSGYGFSWSGGNTSTTDFATYSWITDGPVTVTVYDTVCAVPYSVSSTLNIQVSQPLVVNNITASTDTVVCAGDPVNLTVTATGLAPLNYTWLGSASTVSTATVNPTATQNYSVNVTDQCNTAGINRSINIVVPIYAPLIATSTPDTTVDCPGTNITLQASVTGGAPNQLYLWEGTSNTTLDYNIIPSDTNGVFVKFIVTDVCNNTDTARTRVKLQTYRSIVLTAGNDTSACPDATMPIYANVSRQDYNNGGFAYNWTSNSSNLITGADSIDTYTTISDNLIDTILYVITVTDICNVSKSDTMKVARKPTCNPKTFNVFTPGSGDAANARFIIDAVEEYPGTSVLIFNRWGKKVFESADYKNKDGWDAADVDSGTYYYIVTYQDPPGRKAPEPMTGYVQVIK